MATRKNASKRTTRAKINLDLDESTIKKSSKKAKSATKSLGKNMAIIIVLFLIIGIGLGIGAGFYVCRNDCFEIVGADELTLTIGENYYDEGCKVISLGRDISSDIEIETDLTVNQDGSLTGDETKTYYILYKSNDIKYGKIFTVTKIRLITFVEESESEEFESAQDNTTSNSQNETRSFENAKLSTQLFGLENSKNLIDSLSIICTNKGEING